MSLKSVPLRRQLCQPLENHLLYFRRKAVVVLEFRVPEAAASPELVVDLPGLGNTAAHVVEVTVVIDLRRKYDRRTWRDQGEQFVIVIGNAALVADERSETRVQWQPTTPSGN